jgi:hypothetical protein
VRLESGLRRQHSFPGQRVAVVDHLEGLQKLGGIPPENRLPRRRTSYA